jgi:hypothetical protein
MNYQFKTKQGWSKPYWDFLYIIAYTYPDNPNEQVKKDTKNMLYSLRSLIPCSVCRNHYRKNLINYPPTNKTVCNSNNLFNWISNIHNQVNKSLGKKVLTKDEAKKETYKRLENLDYLYGWGNPIIINSKHFVIAVIIITIIGISYYWKNYS